MALRMTRFGHGRLARSTHARVNTLDRTQQEARRRAQGAKRAKLDSAVPPNYKRNRDAPRDHDSNLEPLETLPKLKPREQRFLEGLIAGKSQSQAYRESHPNCVGWAAGTVTNRASVLARDPRVQAWVRHFQRIGLDQAQVTHSAHLAELARLRELAVIEGQISAGVQAEVHRGKASGLYEDRIRLIADQSDSALLAGVAQLLGDSLATELAGELGSDSTLALVDQSDGQDVVKESQ